MCQGDFTFLMSSLSGNKDGQISTTEWVPLMKHSLQRGGVVTTVMTLLILKPPSIQKLSFFIIILFGQIFHAHTKIRHFSEEVDSLCETN